MNEKGIGLILAVLLTACATPQESFQMQQAGAPRP